MFTERARTALKFLDRERVFTMTVHPGRPHESLVFSISYRAYAEHRAETSYSRCWADAWSRANLKATQLREQLFAARLPDGYWQLSVAPIIRPVRSLLSFA